jgi:hypothetical protein
MAETHEPLRLLPRNPHYFEFRGKPAILITSAEHYGAVLNLDFDYRTCLDTLASHGFNLTRVFGGSYRELPGSFGIATNTLAPKPGRFACPWRQVGSDPETGYERYDLDEWDPAYFERLRDFMQCASERGVVVEYVLFCFWYNDRLWAASPMNAANNVNGAGDVPKEEFHRLNNAPLLAAQDAAVRKTVEELNGFDNLYYEVCNELYSFHDGDLRLDWQHRVADLIADAESGLPNRHLVSINEQNRTMRIRQLHAHVHIHNFHYAFPSAVGDNYHLDRVIGDNETGFKGQTPTPYRREAWEFLLAGGGLFNHLDYSFTVDHPDGTARVEAETPGWGGPEWRRQLEVLRDFMNGLDFASMEPHNDVALFDTPSHVSYQLLADPGRAYAAYFHGGHGRFRLPLALAAGKYAADWVSPLDGHVMRTDGIETAGGMCNLQTPLHGEDIALRILRCG